MAQPAPDSANDMLVRALDRWRRLATVAVAVIAIVANVGFALERSATRDVTRANNVLVLATEAQEAAWTSPRWSVRARPSA